MHTTRYRPHHASVAHDRPLSGVIFPNKPMALGWDDYHFNPPVKAQSDSAHWLHWR
jgi:hypothetical protein